MTVSRKLKSYLDDLGVPYETTVHPTAFTAQEVAASAHVKGDCMAKTVMVKAGGEDIMAVLPATSRISFDELKRVLAAEDARLATEEEFRDRFPECDVGAMPPFGNLYGIKEICDSHLAQHDTIVFNAGSHDEVIRMRYADFAKLVHPTVAPFAHHG